MKNNIICGIVSMLAFSVAVPSAVAETSIPFDLQTSMYGGRITVPCTINGQNFEKCKIDTGANFSSVKKDLLAVSGEVINQVSVKAFSGEDVNCDVTINNKLALQNIVFEKTLLMLCPQLKSSGTDVIIGLDILAQQPLTFDYKNKKLILDATKPEGLSSYTEDATGHILLPVIVNKKNPIPAVAMFDSGAAISLVDIAFVEKHPDAFSIIQDNSVTDTHGNVIPSQLAMIGNIRVGDVTLVAEYIMVVDLSAAKAAMGEDVDFILGHNLAVGATWYFSFDKHLWSAR